MARIRSIKPESFTSLSLSDVDRGVRWTFAGLWTYCDDEGRAVWDARLVKAAIYPADDAVTASVVGDDIAELWGIGAVCVYEVDGRRFIHVPAFHEHQHPNRKVDSKLPPCPGTSEAGHVQQPRPSSTTRPHVQRTEDSLPTQEQLTPVVVVEGRGDVGGEGAALASADTAPAPRSPTPETPNQRAQRLTKTYVDLVPLSRFPAVLGVVKKACDAGKRDDEIEFALRRLAAEGRSLTVETLRIEIEGQPPPRNGRRTTDDKVRDGLELARRLANDTQRQIGA